MKRNFLSTIFCFVVGLAIAQKQETIKLVELLHKDQLESGYTTIDDALVDVNEVSGFTHEEIAIEINKIISDIAKEYEYVYDEDEIDKMVVFFSTDVGKKMLSNEDDRKYEAQKISNGFSDINHKILLISSSQVEEITIDPVEEESGRKNTNATAKATTSQESAATPALEEIPEEIIIDEIFIEEVPLEEGVILGGQKK